MNTSHQPEAVLVLGMHRSGTSATAGALGKLGLNLGDELVPAAADNPGGYFEHATAVSVDEALLEALDRSWDDVRALPPRWMDSAAALEASAAIRERVLPSLQARTPWALKDPRMCRLLPLWRRLLDGEGIKVACVIVVRHPDEVAGSLHARNGMSALQAHICWLRYVLESIAASQDIPRALLSYARLLADPAAALRATAQLLGMDPPMASDLAQLDSFVDAGASHHVASAGADAANPWRALSIQVFRDITETDDPWSRVADRALEFDALCERHAGWIEALGTSAHAASSRLRAQHCQWLHVHGRLDTTQAALDATQLALASAENLAVERLDESMGLRGKLDRTEIGLATAERLALERLAELHKITAEVHRLAAEVQRLERIESSRAWRFSGWIARWFPRLGAWLR